MTYNLSLQSEWDLIEMDDYLDNRLMDFHKKLTYQLFDDIYPRYKNINDLINNKAPSN